MLLLQVKMTRAEKWRLARIAKHHKTSQSMIVRKWIALDPHGDPPAKSRGVAP